MLFRSAPLSRLLPAVVVDVFEVKGVYVTGQIAVGNGYQQMFILEEMDRKQGKTSRTYPRTVRQMLIKRSTPHPATAYTPIGGTVHSS